MGEGLNREEKTEVGKKILLTEHHETLRGRGLHRGSRTSHAGKKEGGDKKGEKPSRQETRLKRGRQFVRARTKKTTSEDVANKSDQKVGHQNEFSNKVQIGIHTNRALPLHYECFRNGSTGGHRRSTASAKHCF